MMIVVLCVFTFPESPKYLYSQRRFDDTRLAFATVARINGITDFDHRQIIFEDEVLQAQTSSERRQNE